MTNTEARDRHAAIPAKPHSQTTLDIAPICHVRRAPSTQHFSAQRLELPQPRQRWTVRRKASVVEAVRGGWIPIEEVCEIYSISVDEFLAWERDLDRYGVYGLRTTRYQIYRDTDKHAPAISETVM